MAQQFYQPKRNISRDDDDGYDDNPLTGGKSEQSSKVSNDAANTLGNIDDVLADNDTLKNKEDKASDSGKSDSGADSASPSLANAEQSAADDKLGVGFTPDFKQDVAQRLKGVLTSNKRKALVGGGIGATVVGLILAGAVFLLPLKIMSITQNLQDKFFATSEQASQKEINKLLQRYISSAVLPGMFAGDCTSTLVNYKCVARGSSTDSPVGRLYNGWRDAKLETKLAQNYGLEIVRKGNTVYIRSDVLQRDIFEGTYNRNGNNGDFDNKMFTSMTRGEARLEVERAIQGETKWKAWYYKVKVKGLLSRKYGVSRCVVACAYIDSKKDSYDAKKLAFKSYFNKLVVQPQSEILSLALDCAMSNFDCAKPDDWSKDGERTSQFSRDLQERLVTFRNTASPESLEELKNKSEDIQKKGFAKTATIDLLTKLGVKGATRIVDLAEPIGWIDLLTHLAAAAKNAPDTIRYMKYAAEAATAVKTFDMFRTQADEIKTGKADPAVIGSFVTALNDASNGGGTDQGGLGAEQSPAYAFVTTGVLAKNSKYKCDDGNPVPADMQVCAEELVGQDQSTIDGLNRFANDNIVRYIPQAQQAELFINTWNFISDHITDWIAKGIQFLMTATPAGKAVYDGFLSAFDTIKEPIFEWIKGFLIANPITDFVSGGRLYTIMTAGADQSASQNAHYGLGGKLLTNQEVAIARNQLRSDRLSELQQKSFASRIFDTTNTESVVSKVALATPTTVSGGASTFATSITSLPRQIFSALTGLNKTLAAEPAIDDPFNIPQYGYGADDPVFEADPETFWKQNKCDDPATTLAWAQAGELNTSTGEFNNFSTNGCALILSAVGSAGAQFTTDVLTEEDMQHLIPDPGVSDPLPGDPSSSNPSAQAVLDSCKNGSATGKVKIVCSSLTLLGLPYADPAHPFTQYLSVTNQPKSVGCNAFVDISILRATNGVYKKEYCSQQFATAGVSDGMFKKIALNSIQPGDIVVRESSCGCTSSGSCNNGHDNLGRFGHVAVVVSYDAATDKIVVAEASSKSRPSGVRDPTTATWSSSNIYGFTFGMQYTGGGL